MVRGMWNIVSLTSGMLLPGLFVLFLHDHRLNFVLAVLKTPGEISFSVRRVRTQCTSRPQYFASYGFAFLYFLNPVENNSEGVPFSMPGRACQDVSKVVF